MDLISFIPKGSLGDIEIVATINETLRDDLETTLHPVEVGSPITDHAFKRPVEVIINCGWSNSSLEALEGSLMADFDGEISSPDYVGGVYSQLLALQESREPFEIVTSKRIYQDMLIQSLTVSTDEKTSSVLMCSAHCRQIIMAYTQATSLPPNANQANPANTAETENSGRKQPTPQ